MIAVSILLIILTLGIYGQTLNHRFINFDVPIYVTENTMVQAGITGPGVLRALTTFESAEWMPLTWLSYMLDYEFFGLDSGAFHLSNVLFHLLSVVLLFLILSEMTGSLYRAAAVTLLFAVHPLRVESVVWIAERKDVLSMFFFLLTLKAYDAFAKNPSQKPMYGVMLTFFALGLMSKAMLITVPFLLLLLDYWPLGRLKTGRDFSVLLREKMPMMILAAAAGILNFAAVKAAGGMASLESLPFTDRLQNALVCYGRYLKKTFWPVNLAHFYPYQKQYLTLAVVTAAVLILAAITLAALKTRKKNPAILTGWLWFLGTLVPVIGLIQAGTQSMADRYTYIPHIGLFLAMVWAAASVLDRWKIPLYLRAAGFVIILMPLTWLSWKQVSYWQNSIVLNKRAMSVTKGNYIAHENMAFALAKRKRYDESREYYEKALQIEPNRVRNLYNLGLLALNQGEYPEARDFFLKVLEARPGNLEALNGLGVADLKTNQPEEAIKYFMEALSLNRRYIPARKGLAYAYIQTGQLREARYHLNILMQEAGQKDSDVLVLAGLLTGSEGNYEDSIVVYEKILEQHPRNVDALFAAGNSHLNLREFAKAISYFERALQVNPDLPNVHKNLGIAFGKQGDTAKAEAHFKKALELKPDSARVHYRWGRMLAGQMKWKEAEAHYQEAKRLNSEVPGLTKAMEELAEFRQQAPTTIEALR